MAENEDAFAIDAQDHVVLSRGQEPSAQRRKTRAPTRSAATDPKGHDEESPLLPGKTHLREIATTEDTSTNSFGAITKPWTAFEDLPWYKRPSVRGNIYHSRLMLICSGDLLAPSCILPFLSCLGWTHRTENLPYPQSDMSRLPL
jgi:hypothetical protein